MRARIGAGLVAATVAASLALSSAPAADAAAYRYWTYWQGTAGAWTFATAGPAALVPADGSVEGWVFGVTTESGDPDDAPARTPDVAAICADTPAAPDRKRVALVVDPGPAAVAPDGESPPAAVATCVVAESGATGYEILRSVAQVRTDKGLICGIAGYPAAECAPVLEEAEATALLAAAEAAASADPASPAPSVTGLPAGPDGDSGVGGGSPLATIVVAALLIGAAGLLIGRRRRG